MPVATASNVVTSAQEMADRPRNLRSRQRSRGDLVKQRLEQMMIALIDDRDTNRRTGQTMGDLETAEAGADDDDAMGAR
jgi:hypothetical protein